MIGARKFTGAVAICRRPTVIQQEFRTLVDRALAEHNLPSRKLFAPLPPIGIGTGEVESLGSYVWRLAEHHGVTFSAMYYNVLPWLARGNTENVGRFSRGGARGWRDRDVESRYARATQLATGLDGLEYLTFTPLFRAIKHGWGSRERFLAYRWCPACLATSRHGRLLWSVASVTVCHVHDTKLMESCAVCGRPGFQMYGGNYSPVRCWHCGSDLQGQISTGTPTAKEGRLAKSCANLLSIAEKLPGEKDLSTRRVKEACTSIGCSSKRLAMVAGVTSGAVSQWWTGATSPSLGAMLNIADSLHVLLGDFLLGDNGTMPKSPKVNRPTGKFSAEEAAEIRRLLLGSEGETAIRKIALRFRVAQGTITKNFQLECDEYRRNRRSRRGSGPKAKSSIGNDVTPPSPPN